VRPPSRASSTTTAPVSESERPTLPLAAEIEGQDARRRAAAHLAKRVSAPILGGAPAERIHPPAGPGSCRRLRFEIALILPAHHIPSGSAAPDPIRAFSAATREPAISSSVISPT
jgi:hypothetical protein